MGAFGVVVLALGRERGAGMAQGREPRLVQEFIPRAAVFPINGRLRDECLNEHLFVGLRHARQLIAAWRDDDNHHRPHTSLDGLTPREYFNRSEKDQTRNRLNF